jgi:hypothetical protein
MLRFAQHDKRGVIPSALFFVIPSESEESSAMRMLHFAQHDKCGVIPNAVRNPVRGCFTALALRSA